MYFIHKHLKRCQHIHIGMKVIIVNDVKSRVHPIYENYAASEDGKVINVTR